MSRPKFYRGYLDISDMATFQEKTYFGRFADLDDQIIPYFDNNLSIHDVGCSTGVTSLDLYGPVKK